MKVSSIAVWCMMMALIVAAASARLTWTVDSDSEKYSSFLDSLREEFGRGTPKVCNIPVTKETNNKKFILVDLISPFNGNTITLAFRASDAYLVGFQDTVSEKNVNKLRANFFSDEYQNLKSIYKSIFGDAAILGQELPCKSRYPDLVFTAGVGLRENTTLGVGSLQADFKSVYGKDFNAKGENNGKKVANFALISIQMVAEAARFKYIEDEVKTRGMYGTFQAGARITLLENNWSKISNKYYDSCQPKVDGFTEKEIKLGLLQYKQGKKTRLNSNDGHAAVAIV